MKHENYTGECEKCKTIFHRYKNPNKELMEWFRTLQRKIPDAHVSCVGRGRIDQEEAFQRGASKAHWGKSSHNYNCALDLFQLKDGGALWDKKWFHTNISPYIITTLKWYGSPGSSFYELPHVEISNWKELVEVQMAKLVDN